jgi:biopolymer transport protein ExbD
MNFRRKIKSHGEMHTGALNDIMFILLFFFLIVSTLANPNVIKLSLPKSKSDAKAKQTVVVSIDINRKFYIGTSLTAKEELATKLKDILSRETEHTIAINADKGVPVEDVVEVMKIATALGAKSVLKVDAAGEK